MTPYKDVWYLFEHNKTKEIRESTVFSRQPDETFLHIMYGTRNEVRAHIRKVRKLARTARLTTKHRVAGFLCLVAIALMAVYSFWSV